MLNYRCRPKKNGQSIRGQRDTLIKRYPRYSYRTRNSDTFRVNCRVCSAVLLDGHVRFEALNPTRCKSSHGSGASASLNGNIGEIGFILIDSPRTQVSDPLPVQWHWRNIACYYLWQSCCFFEARLRSKRAASQTLAQFLEAARWVQYRCQMICEQIGLSLSLSFSLLTNKTAPIHSSGSKVDAGTNTKAINAAIKECHAKYPTG